MSDDDRSQEMKQHGINFDNALALLASDPAEFNRQARVQIESVIQGAPAEMQPRLRALQFTIDTKLGLVNDPQERFQLMVHMFWEGFYRFNDVLNGRLPSNYHDEPAPIVEFPKNNT